MIRIGITLDSQNPGGYSKMPWYALRKNYCEEIYRAGGIPFPLPHFPELVDEYLNQIDGLLVTGGNFDINPALYTKDNAHASVTLNQSRTDFEWRLLKGALERNLPVLGVCGGQQLLNVVLGGTLHQHIPDAFTSPLPHEQPNPRWEGGHEITVIENTILRKITGASSFLVNSAHHQAVDQVGPGVLVNAHASDGVIEGIEAPSYTFCLGVQWHPEYAISAHDRALFSSFIQACKPCALQK